MFVISYKRFSIFIITIFFFVYGSLVHCDTKEVIPHVSAGALSAPTIQKANLLISVRLSATTCSASSAPALHLCLHLLYISVHTDTYGYIR